MLKIRDTKPNQCEWREDCDPKSELIGCLYKWVPGWYCKHCAELCKECDRAIEKDKS